MLAVLRPKLRLPWLLVVLPRLQHQSWPNPGLHGSCSPQPQSHVDGDESADGNRPGLPSATAVLLVLPV
jgi:hypothetical protein|eukprot:COSAG01_NODE_2481_length_7603_cov_4.629398_8_plen_69_part_00